LEIKSWENKEFVDAIKTAENKVLGDLNKYNNLYQKEYEYVQKYGEKKLASDFKKYEKITGTDWGKSLKSFDPTSQNIENFHREVVIPAINK